MFVEVNKLIKGEHLHNEINEIKKVAEELEDKGELFQANALKAHTLALKLLLNIRQNQVAIMPKDKMIQPKIKSDEKE